VNEAITVAQRNRNVYIDLSEYEFSPMAEAYVEAANTMIGDKILYASAHPFVDFRIALKNYEKLPFNPEVKQKIMYDNAAKLLGLRPAAASGRTDAPPMQDLVGEIVREVMARLGR
jgi:predicted TIM-barrel fold metal-dependent hydrolase